MADSMSVRIGHKGAPAGSERCSGPAGCRWFVHRSMVPLRLVGIGAPEDHGQMAFLGECEGMCGV